MNIVRLPPNLSLSSLGGVIRQTVQPHHLRGKQPLTFDFSNLAFADTAGVVGLGNLVKYVQSLGVYVYFDNVQRDVEVLRYMDGAGFFEEFTESKLDESACHKGTTVPFINFRDEQYNGYLYGQLTPWIASEVNLSEDTISTIRTCLEEAFHNVRYHSGVSSGCTLSQHYPHKRQLRFALSDYGRGIPALVRTVKHFDSDARCIRQACVEGFSTKSNVRNRGAGLAILIRYVVERNGGSVELRSQNGYLRAYAVNGVLNWETRDLGWAYPGTMVHVTLRTDTLERLDTYVEPEVFTW